MNDREKLLYSLLGKTVHVVVDRPISHRHKGTVYPVNYGYIPGIIAGDGEAQDAYILGVDTPLETFDGRVIGAVCRRNDCEDKLIVAPEGVTLHQGQIAEAVAFQERYFDSYVIPLFHKSCGVLPYRVLDGSREFLVVYQRGSQCWSLPKGHMEAWETELQAALREMKEETGLTAVPDSENAAVIEYPISPIGRKQVVLFLGKVSGMPKIRDGEIDSFRWITAEQLQDYLRPDAVAACRKLLEKES